MSPPFFSALNIQSKSVLEYHQKQPIAFYMLHFFFQPKYQDESDHVEFFYQNQMLRKSLLLDCLMSININIKFQINSMGS